MIWVVFAALSVVTVGSLWLGLRRMLRTASETFAEGAARDLGIYRDQLAELDRDLARGIVTPEDATQARTEISRRILDADRRMTHGAEGVVKTSTALPYAALLFVPLAAAGLYAALGRPALPDLPIAERLRAAEEARLNRPSQAEAVADAPKQAMPAPEPEYAALMKRLRDAVAARPDDVQGQSLLAANEAKLGNYDAALAAQDQVIALQGAAARADDLATRAEIRIFAAQGYVSPEAEADLTEALRRDPTNVPARYFSGLLMTQTGRPDLAFRLWASLLEEVPPDAPWAKTIRVQIETLAWFAGEPDYQPPGTAPGPDAADMQAAVDMTPEERAQMISGMVAGLAERLASEGGSAEEWARLVNAYGQLGEKDKAAKAYADAKAALDGDAAGLAQVEEAAARAGVNQ